MSFSLDNSFLGLDSEHFLILLLTVCQGDAVSFRSVYGLEVKGLGDTVGKTAEMTEKLQRNESLSEAMARCDLCRVLDPLDPLDPVDPC